MADIQLLMNSHSQVLTDVVMNSSYSLTFIMKLLFKYLSTLTAFPFLSRLKMGMTIKGTSLGGLTDFN